MTTRHINRWHATGYVNLSAYPLAIGLVATHPQGWQMCAPFLLMAAPTAYVVKRARQINRVSYAILMAHALLMAMTAAVTTYFAGPAWPWSVATMLVSMATIAVYLHADARHAYGSDRGHGIRQFVRHQVAIEAGITTANERITGETYDLSEGGAYLVSHVDHFEMGDRISVELRSRRGESLLLRARVVSTNPNGVGHKPPGVGLQFLAMSAFERKKLRSFFAAARRHHRYIVSLPMHVYSHAGTMQVTTVDLSESGCFIKGMPTLLSPGERVMAHLDLAENKRLEVLAEVVWHADQVQARREGVALKFTSLGRAETEAIRNRLAANDVAVHMTAAA